eukprot:1159045-Pelagomonas_calceolata.AAC.15
MQRAHELAALGCDDEWREQCWGAYSCPRAFHACVRGRCPGAELLCHRPRCLRMSHSSITCIYVCNQSTQHTSARKRSRWGGSEESSVVASPIAIMASYRHSRKNTSPDLKAACRQGGQSGDDGGAQLFKGTKEGGL